MRVAFRVDASARIGSGHLTRCLTLANALRERGAEVTFICREHDQHAGHALEGQTVAWLPASGSEFRASADRPSYAESVGASWQDDAEQTARALEGQSIDWLVVDHYGLDHRWERQLRRSTGRIMVIDDLADRAHDCDVLLDQNLVADMDKRYVGKVPAHCTVCLGPRYALLGPAYTQARSAGQRRVGPVERILVCFGGTDPFDLAGRVFTACLRLQRSDIAVDFVVPDSAVDVLRARSSRYANLQVLGSLPTLAPLMTRASLAVGAGGATSWERLCLGLYALVITVAENQRAVAEELDRQRLIRWLGTEQQATVDVIELGLREALADQGARERLAGNNLVDGRGVDRIIRCLVSAMSQSAALPSADFIPHHHT